MEAGFEPGDRVIRIENQEIVTWADMTSIVSEHADSPVNFQVKRDGTFVTLVATPRTHERVINGETTKRATIGISGGPFQALHADTFSEALIEGARATWVGTKLIGYTLYKLLSGEVSRKAIAGPLGIATISGQAAEKGVEAVIWLIALLSINLGVLNLLPIPILDGGHLFFFGARRYFAETLRRTSARNRPAGWTCAADLHFYPRLMERHRASSVELNSACELQKPLSPPFGKILAKPKRSATVSCCGLA